MTALEIAYKTAVVCRPFWPVSYGSELMWDAGYSQFNVSLISMDDFTPRTIRLRLEVRKDFFQRFNASFH
jgi:hypothetical protein